MHSPHTHTYTHSHTQAGSHTHIHTLSRKLIFTSHTHTETDSRSYVYPHTQRQAYTHIHPTPSTHTHTLTPPHRRAHTHIHPPHTHTHHPPHTGWLTHTRTPFCRHSPPSRLPSCPTHMLSYLASCFRLISSNFPKSRLKSEQMLRLWSLFRESLKIVPGSWSEESFSGCWACGHRRRVWQQQLEVGGEGSRGRH